VAAAAGMEAAAEVATAATPAQAAEQTPATTPAEQRELVGAGAAGPRTAGEGKRHATAA